MAGVLLLGVIQNLINQVGTLSSDYQQVVSGAFLVVVVVIHDLSEPPAASVTARPAHL